MVTLHLMCTTTTPCPMTSKPVNTWVVPCGASFLTDISIDDVTWDESEVTCPECRAIIDKENTCIS